MNKQRTLIQKHNLISELNFYMKSWVFMSKRQIQDILTGPRKFRISDTLKDAPVISVSESVLWNPDDNEGNWILTAGKVQNLRLAAKKLNGLVVKAGEVFSFWKHIGNPNFGQGFVVGREIREGCIVPTVAGGLCQVSNALYDAALKANFEIIERHRHTKVIKGSLAETDRDATVKWNYVDLRFRSSRDFRIEIEIAADKFLLQFRSMGRNDSEEVHEKKELLFSKLNDCFSCGNFTCFKHPDKKEILREQALTTFILDDKWEENDRYIQQISEKKDHFILPLKKNRFIKTNQYNWTIGADSVVKQTFLAAMYRAAKLKYRRGGNAFALMLEMDKKVAKAAAGKIPIACTHVVISQTLLPYVWESGVLGGRSFDVLMSRMPMERLHTRLDEAHALHPESGTLHDFRASEQLVELESIALTKSRKIITPHEEIAAIFNNKSIKLDWILPKGEKKRPGNKILFPASTLGRKGAYEVRELAREFGLEILVSGRNIENDTFWEGIKTENYGPNIFLDVGLVLYPVYVEHQPRMLLKALSMGIPVITTKASGLSEMEGLTIIENGDYQGLKNAFLQWRES